MKVVEHNLCTLIVFKHQKSHLNLGHNWYVKYPDPSSSGSPVLLTIFHRLVMQKSNKTALLNKMPSRKGR